MASLRISKPQILFCIIIICLISSTSASDANPATIVTAYDELSKHGFPIGLLPANVLSYSLNRTTGRFAVDMGGTCRVTLPPDNYLAAYSHRISGKLLENRIAELYGINVRAFFKWWGITGIRSSGQDLVFEVGMVTAKYPSKNFHQSPPCEGRSSS